MTLTKRKIFIFIFAVILAFTFLVSCLIINTSSAEGEEFVINNGVLTKYNGNDTAVKIPKGIHSVGSSAFINNTNIKTIDFNSQIYYVGNKAFYGCTNLEKISNYKNVSEVGALAFNKTKWFSKQSTDIKYINDIAIGCDSSVTEIKFENNITSVAPSAFKDNTGLKSVAFNKGLIKIGDNAFNGCSALSKITFSDTIKSVGGYAFENTPWLSNQKDDFVTVNSSLIKYNGKDNSVTVPKNITEICTGSFAYSKITDISFSESVKIIRSKAFESSEIETVKLNKNLFYLGDNAFKDCKNLTSVTLSDTLRYIGKGSLESVKKICLSKNYNTDVFSDFKNSILIVYKNSPAYNYAKDNNFTYYLYENIGDVNSDGIISMLDVTSVQRYISNMEDFDASMYNYADVNFDNKITMLDVIAIQRTIAGY